MLLRMTVTRQVYEASAKIELLSEFKMGTVEEACEYVHDSAAFV